MGFNYAHEKARFDREWEKTQQTYRAAGINEEAIQEMHDFDWSLFKKERIYQLHTQKLEGTDFGGEDSAQTDKSPLLKKSLQNLASAMIIPPSADTAGSMICRIRSWLGVCLCFRRRIWNC